MTRADSSRWRIRRNLGQVLVLTISTCYPLLISGQINCAGFSDPEGAKLKHSDSRRRPCYDAEGSPLALRAPCAYNLTLTGEINIQGCCWQETTGGQFYCASDRSKAASPAAAMYHQVAGIVHTCQGGNLYARDVTDLDEAAVNDNNYILCKSDTDPGPVCDASVSVLWKTAPSGVINNMCKCMAGSQQESGKYCQCLAPNTGQDCSKDSDCTGGGKCETRATFLDSYKTEGTSEAHLESYQRPDGVELKRYKETSWFGDETFDTRPASIYTWAYYEPSTETWVEYEDFNNEALEYAFRKNKKIAHVDLDGYSRTDVFVDFEGMRQLDSTGASKEVRRQAQAGGLHSPEKYRVEDLGGLNSGESLRRASVSP